MSSPSNTALSSSTFETLFNAALANYNKLTGKDLRNHPLADKIDGCNTSDSILRIFQEELRAFDEFKNGDAKLIKWLTPVVDVLHTLSTNAVLKDSVSHVSPSTSLIVHSV